jgi:hypothetical protein
MKLITQSKPLLFSALLAVTALSSAHAAKDELSISIDDSGAIHHGSKVITADELRSLASDLARKNPNISVSVTTDDEDEKAKAVVDTLRSVGVKKIVVHENGTNEQNGEPATAAVRFSDATKPGTLKVIVTNGDIHIVGSDRADIQVRTELKPEGAAQRKDGLRVLTSSSSYSLTEKDNIATLSYGTDSWPNGGGDFDISVPRNTNVVISSAYGGDIDIGNVTGNLEVKSLNGEVRLADVTGVALVETMNGGIHADVRSVTEGTPLSFTSMNGEVSLRLAPDLKANVRLRTHNGSILTDFDEKQLITKTVASKGDRKGHGPHSLPNGADPDEIRATVREAVRMGIDAAREAARGAREAMQEANGHSDDSNDDHEHAIPVPPVAPLPPMTGGKTVTGTLNGGGAEIRITTMNGDVTLRKLPTK